MFIDIFLTEFSYHFSFLRIVLFFFFAGRNIANTFVIGDLLTGLLQHLHYLVLVIINFNILNIKSANT